jgi:chloride channel protein, CIC family
VQPGALPIPHPLTEEASHAEANAEIAWPAYLGLIAAAAVIGALVACCVWLFDKVMGIAHDLAFTRLGGLLQPLGPWSVALIPALGGIVVALLLAAFSKPDKFAAMAHLIERVGHGSGRLNVRNGAAFIVASALGIGFGAPVGADTPCAMIGGHLASFCGTRLRLRDSFVRALVVAGAGAGIGVTYMAQLAGTFFALEIVLAGFGGWLYIVPTLIAMASAQLVAADLLGYKPLYGGITVASTEIRDVWVLLMYIGVGLLAALAAIAYVNLLPKMKLYWGRVHVPFWARTALAGLLVGIVGIWVPDIFGSGLSQAKQIFAGTAFPLSTLVALFLFKLILTPQSLGGGFAGGVIGPALLIGAALGQVYGQAILHLAPNSGIDPTACAMVAAVAMLAGTFHAPLFAVAMLYEMTGNYAFLIPMFFAAGLSYLLARRFQPGSAYTFALRGAGLVVRQGTGELVSLAEWS